MSFVVRCSVSGGVTGNRYSTLKTREGNIRYFPTREAAHEVAKECNTEMNGGHAVAHFRYWVEAEPVPHNNELANVKRIGK